MLERLEAAAAQVDDPAGQATAVAAEKAAIVIEAWADYPGRNGDGVATIAVPGGEATLGHMQAGEVEGVACVEVWTGPRAGPPQFRLVNPPLLVADPRGPVEVTGRGDRPVPRRYREDPIAAVATVITGGGR